MSTYARLATEQAPKKARDWTARWEQLQEVASVNGTSSERIADFCKQKGITLEALAALGARVTTRRGGGTWLAFAGTTRDGGKIIAIKYRPVGGSSHQSEAEAPSVWLCPIVAGNASSLDWFFTEGETDGARLYDLVGDAAAILVLPAGARAFKREWADRVPRGATVYLCHDADDDGDAGAEKAAKTIGGAAIRLRPPNTDWCDWRGTRDEFAQLVREAKARRDSTTGLVATPLVNVEMRSIKWLEKPLWQASAFQLLAGAKGSGKGTYLCALASRISRLGSNVLFLSSEDSVEVDLKPRLVAADAALERCYCIQQHVRLPDDVDRLRELALELGGVGLLVVDPVANHIGDRNSNSDAEVRNAIAPLNGLADELDCLLIGVRHPGKDRTRGALASILGSTAWVDTPRAVVMVALDDEDPLVRHIQVVAGNRSLNGSAQAFRIDAVDVDGLDEPITLAVALGESEKSVEDLVGTKPEGKTRVSADLVQDAVLAALATGEKSREYLNTSCLDELGVNADTVYKSGLVPLRETGRIRARKAGFNEGWYWRLEGTSDDPT